MTHTAIFEITLTSDFSSAVQGPVVRTPVSANLGLNFNPGFFFFLSKAHYRIIFSILFRVSSHQIVGKENSTEFAFKLSYPSSNFALIVGYLNPFSNNPALAHWRSTFFSLEISVFPKKKRHNPWVRLASSQALGLFTKKLRYMTYHRNVIYNPSNIQLQRTRSQAN